MRNIYAFVLTLAVAGVLAAGCKEKSKVWDPEAKVSLRPAVGIKAASAVNTDGVASAEAGTQAGDESPASKHFSALEIVEQCTQLNFYSPMDKQYTGRGFADVQRDIANVRLLMWGTDIISDNGDLVDAFIQAQDVVFTISNGFAITDTIAYIPNALLRSAEKSIRAAHAEGDFESVYRIFDQTYRFNPITGAEWRALKAQGLQ